MTWIAFDTETSGLLVRDRPLSDPAQPHIAQIGAVLVDAEFHQMASLDCFIQPDGWHVTEEAREMNGISTETCARFGLPIQVALAALIEMVKRAKYVVGHNFDFDRDLVEIEILRLGSDDMGFRRPRLRVIDTMKIGAAAAPDGQWPSLAELHRILIGLDYEKHHSALSDAHASLRCAMTMVERKMIEL